MQAGEGYETVISRPSESFSLTPRNMTFNLSLAMQVLSQTSALTITDDPVAQTSIGLALARLVYDQARVTISPEASFTYWVCYKSEGIHEPIPVDEIPNIVLDKHNDVENDVFESLTTDTVERTIRKALDELADSECIYMIEKDDDTHIVLTLLRSRLTL